MPLSTDVNLPRNHSARFPSSCVRCGNDPANGTVRLWTHTLGWWTWVLWMFGRGFATHAPACTGCGWRIRFQRIGGTLLTLAVAAAFLVFVWPYLDDFIAPNSEMGSDGPNLCLPCTLYALGDIFSSFN